MRNKLSPRFSFAESRQAIFRCTIHALCLGVLIGTVFLVTSCTILQVTDSETPTVQGTILPTTVPKPHATAVPTETRSPILAGNLFVVLREHDSQRTPLLESLSSDIWIANIQGELLRNWIPDGRAKEGPHVSSNHRQVAYVVFEGDSQSLWVAQLDGSQAQRISPLYPKSRQHPVFLTKISWSPDNHWLTYWVYEEHSDEAQYYVINVMTRQVQPIGTPGSLYHLEWVPREGHRLLIGDQQRQYSIVDFEVNDSWPIDLPPSLTGHAPLRITPDGSSLYIISNKELVVMDIDGHNPRTLGGSGVTEVLWSPDGTHVVLLKVSEDALYILDRNGQHLRKLATGREFCPEGDSYELCSLWSADGQWFGVEATNLFATKERYQSLYLVHRETGAVHKVLTSQGNDPIMGWEWYPAE